MPDKLTDEQIKKALECCNTEYDDYQCPHCPLLHKGCKKALIQNALDLINRQDAEIEKLKNTVGILTNNAVDFANEIDRHKKDKADAFIMTGQIIDAEKIVIAEAKAEAYKRVFEKLNDKSLVRKIKLFGNWFIVKGVTLHDINTLKKEMVGDSE